MKKLSKNTMLLAGAIALGLVCFFGANYYLRNYLMAAESRLAGSYATRKVMVASVDVPAGSILSAENIATRSIPDRYLASTALGPDSFDVVSGQKIMVSLKPGDPIDRGSLERTDSAALSTTVEKGERAITFPVDEISSISGMLVPGDIIDLMYTGPGTTANSYLPAGGADPQAAPKDLTHVRLILQAVAVMATGKTTQKRVVRTEGGGQEEVNMDFTTVTLKVSPPQAQQVLIAQKLGQLTAVLRNPEDKMVLSKMVLDETTFRQVEGPAAADNYLEMIIGGTGQAGGARSRSAIAGEALAMNTALPNAAGSPSALPAAPPAPNALDVRSRLGIGTPTHTSSSAHSNKP